MFSTPQKFSPGLFLLLAAQLTPAANAQDQPSPAATHRLQAHRWSQPITLDGRLDEPAWQLAGVASGFTQREPEPGAPASERTEVRVVYTEQTLYVGVHAFDQKPAPASSGAARSGVESFA